MYNKDMEKRKFEYDVDFGAIMDFVEDHFMLVIKDQEWSEEEVALIKQGAKINFCYTNELAIFVLEGGDIDSSDFYFNIQECDFKETLFKTKNLDIELVLVDKDNWICFSKRKTLTLEESAIIIDYLKRQNEIEFMPQEYEVNVEGIQSAYQPYELEKFSKVSFKL